MLKQYFATVARVNKARKGSDVKNKNKIISLYFLILMSLLQVHLSEPFIYRLITETLQNNVAGEPITHQRTEWDFDPEISQKRRSLFFETHGVKAERFIERIGVGLDGLEEERRIEQRHRDAGRLNGAHNIIYPSLNVHK